LSAFIAERSGAGLARSTVRGRCGALRVFLRFCYREGIVERDLCDAIGWPQVYRLSTVPRSISWDEVGQVLDGVDRRTPVGKRDYAILLLLVTYGLRGREVAALVLDDIDWRHDRLAVPARKAGHSTAFPLAASVGAAIADYLQHGRPDTNDRHVFMRAVAPVEPIRAAAVSGCARRHLLKAGIDVPRPGAHTLRHTAVQRLVDAQFPLKTIGDFIGHRSPRSTEVYAKVDVARLRQVAMGDGEEVLGLSETLAATVDRFLADRRALGRKYLSEQAELTLLVRFATSREVDRLDGLTPQLLDEFLASRPRTRPRSFNHLLGVVAVFLDWAVSQQLLNGSPLRTRRRRTTAERLPFIFNPTQARRLLDAAGRLGDNPRAHARGVTYRTIFALCYGLGLRAGEACGLRVRDIDVQRQLLLVRGGKFGKTRLVPHGPRIGELLAGQLERLVVSDAYAPSPARTADRHSEVDKRCPTRRSST
jgi:site-specific recombinase XerD